jgi:hypothetical protein
MAESALPSDLVAAARKWETEFQKKNIESKRIDKAEWSVLRAETRSLVPSYLVELLANHALVGPVFEIKSKRRYSYLSSEFFAFSPVWWYQERIAGSIISEEILKPGFCPIGDGENGDKWLIKQAGDPSMSVHLFYLSGMKITEIEPTMASFLNNLKFFG